MHVPRSAPRLGTSFARPALVRLVRLAAPALVLSLLLSAASPASAGLTCDRVPELLRAYLNKHYSFRYLNDELRNRTVESYIKRLDPSKSLFLTDEKDKLALDLQGVFQDVRSGDCSKLLAIRDDIVKRYEQMQVFVKEFVGSDDYALDPTVELIIDPDQRARPRTPEERDDLYRRLVHFQMSNYMANGEKLADAKHKLIHRYELMTLRAKEQDDDDVYAAFLDSFATALDPHSNYFTAEAVEDFQIGMELELEGIGVALTSRDGYSVVEKIIPGGAADKIGGIQPQDKIIAVAQEDGEFVDIIDMDLRDVVRLIRGKRGTTVRLSILRQGEQTERLVVSIVRDKVKLEDQAAALRFEQVDSGDGKMLKLAVLELPSFYGGRNPTERQSSRDMRELLRKVKEEKADGLLLDLSRNGGGLLENSVEIAGFFIRNGGVVAVKDSFSKVQVLRDPDDSLLYDGPMVLLTSRVSASASEIVAGAMKDYRRAVVVGDDHTFGKGTVQSMVPLPRDLGALKVTTAVFFRPGGRSTQHEGVSADIVFPSLYAAGELGEKYQDYSLPSQQIAPFLDESSTPAPNQSDASYWQPVTPDLVQKLAARSAERVAKSQEFADIRKQIAETEERNGVLHISDIYKPTDAAGTPADGSDKKDEKDKKDTASSDGATETAKTESAKADPGKVSGAGLPGNGAVASTAGEGSPSGDLAHIPPSSQPDGEPGGDHEELSPSSARRSRSWPTSCASKAEARACGSRSACCWLPSSSAPCSTSPARRRRSSARCASASDPARTAPRYRGRTGSRRCGRPPPPPAHPCRAASPRAWSATGRPPGLPPAPIDPGALLPSPARWRREPPKPSSRRRHPSTCAGTRRRESTRIDIGAPMSSDRPDPLDSLDQPTRERIESLVRQNDVVLFMKGNRGAPQCGFSATVVQILDTLMPEYATADVLSDPALRDGIKVYSSWPTIPQLYVKGEFVGGCDIVQELFGSGELHGLLGIELDPDADPRITISDEASRALQEAVAGAAGDGRELHLAVDARYQASLAMAPRGPRDIQVEANGVTLLVDPLSARRADGVTIDAVETARGIGFRIENPNDPSAPSRPGAGA